MIGIVIPVHNEEEDLEACIQALQKSIQEIVHLNIPVQTLFVLDNCIDESYNIIVNQNQNYIQCAFESVGKARHLGVQELIHLGATWIASTDADSTVHHDWLYHQIQHQPTDVICGVVEIKDWRNLSSSSRKKYTDHYQDRMGHEHIHGANLSFSREAYLAVGGFDPITCHEDVKLVEKFKKNNYSITWSNQVRVTTSSRLNARAPNGFSTFLTTINTEQS